MLRFPFFLRCVVCGLSLVFLTAGNTTILGQQAKSTTTVGSADFHVTLELTLADQLPVVVKTRAGELATLTDRELDYSIGIIPHVIDATGGDIELEVIRLANPKGQELPERVERLQAKIGFDSVTAAAGQLPLSIRVKDLSNLTHDEFFVGRDTLNRPPDKTIFNQAEGCCVTCGSVSACGCGVTAGCGSCDGGC